MPESEEDSDSDNHKHNEIVSLDKINQDITAVEFLRPSNCFDILSAKSENFDDLINIVKSMGLYGAISLKIRIQALLEGDLVMYYMICIATYLYINKKEYERIDILRKLNNKEKIRNHKFLIENVNVHNIKQHLDLLFMSAKVLFGVFQPNCVQKHSGPNDQIRNLIQLLKDYTKINVTHGKRKIDKNGIKVKWNSTSFSESNIAICFEANAIEENKTQNTKYCCIHFMFSKLQYIIPYCDTLPLPMPILSIDCHSKSPSHVQLFKFLTDLQYTNSSYKRNDTDSSDEEEYHPKKAQQKKAKAKAKAKANNSDSSDDLKEKAKAKSNKYNSDASDDDDAKLNDDVTVVKNAKAKINKNSSDSSSNSESEKDKDSKIVNILHINSDDEEKKDMPSPKDAHFILERPNVQNQPNIKKELGATKGGREAPLRVSPIILENNPVVEQKDVEEIRYQLPPRGTSLRNRY